MIDKWFRKDLDKIFSTHQIAVFIDETGDAGFLPEVIKDDYALLTAHTEVDELRIKYEIEKNRHKKEKYLIYTSTPRENLKFIREYCETNGCIEIRYLQNYVKDKVHKHLNLNLHLDKEELISAAKVSVGKDQTYWMDLSHKGASEIFDLTKELLPFLDNPKTWLNKYDKNVQEIFFKKVNDLIGQTYMKKPPATLAAEVVNAMLNGLLSNQPQKILLEVYYNWLDSKTYQKSFEGYLKKYKMPAKSDVFSVHPAHPFAAIDEKWLEQLGQRMDDKPFVESFLQLINERIRNRASKNLGITFWGHVKTLLEFDANNINQLASFDECVKFYTTHFHKVDNAIRNLYAQFLQHTDLIRPLQYRYKSYVSVFLDKWFRYIDDYQSNQTGKIQEIIDANDQKTAIVLGDGVSYEFAHEIMKGVSKEYPLDNKPTWMMAGLPSDTVCNMSRLYVKTGETIPNKKDRESFLLKDNQDKDIGFIDLDQVNELTDQNHYLICSCKEPDKLGETYQQKALKYFDGVKQFYISKIEQLLKNGYKNVYLVTDHGFVLTGILQDADKIEVVFKGKVDKNERFIRTMERQSIDKNLLLEKEILCDDYQWCYFAKRMGPFRTPGVYGFSHGGIAPQETIIPFLKWTHSTDSQDVLRVFISNKNDLKDIPADLYALKLKAETFSENLFTRERKVMILFFAGEKKVNESDIITIEKNKEIRKEYQFGKYTHLDVIVLDAITKEQLDKVTITKSAARDLGGLL